VETTEWGSVKVDSDTLVTERPGLFAGGDVVTGPNTVVRAIAAGKKAAVMIRRYLEGEPLRQPEAPARPSAYIEPLPDDQLGVVDERPKVQHAEILDFSGNFIEVEKAFSAAAARAEAANCLRCDLEFIEPAAKEAVAAGSGGDSK